LAGAGVYFVTARTLHQTHYFRGPDRLTQVRDLLLAMAVKYNWRLEAWAVLSNHYHFVAHSPPGETSADSLGRLLKNLHADIARHINRLDGVQGRKVMHNYRETHLTYQRSYLARLNYTHHNPVHHGLLTHASDYEWCSSAQFEKSATPAWLKTIQSFRYDEIAREDDD
jgi:putative transposase